MIIKFEDISFGYTSRTILKDITLDITGPKFVSIIGPNGVGKSTILRCINNLLVPDKGAVYIDDTKTTDINIKEMAKLTGYVATTSSEAFPLTVVDTVLMGRNAYAKWKSDNEDLEKVYDSLKLLDIENLAMRVSNELSAGQRQKVMLARGIVQEPKILLLDEPTSNLDVRHQMEVADILQRMSKEKDMTIVMICHDLNIAAKYSDEIIMMYRGKIFAAGKPNDVITEENLQEVYKIKCEVNYDGGYPHIILNDYIKDVEEDDE